VAALILDASVLVGLLDSAESHHAIAVDAVESADTRGIPLLTPASAYSEALVALLRLPDAIVLATARELRADLLTYDERLAHRDR